MKRTATVTSRIASINRRMYAACGLMALTVLLAIAPTFSAPPQPGDDLKLRTAKAPAIVDLKLREQDILDRNQAALEAAGNEAIARIAAANAREAGRLITLRLTGAKLTLEDQRYRELLAAGGPREANQVAAAYEHTLGGYLEALLDAVRSSQTDIALSVMGLPVESRRAAGSGESNRHYRGAMDRIDAFVPAKSIVLSGGTVTERIALRDGLPNSLALRDGRPIIYQANGGWRIALNSETVGDQPLRSADAEQQQAEEQSGEAEQPEVPDSEFGVIVEDEEANADDPFDGPSEADMWSDGYEDDLALLASGTDGNAGSSSGNNLLYKFHTGDNTPIGRARRGSSGGGGGSGGGGSGGGGSGGGGSGGGGGGGSGGGGGGGSGGGGSGGGDPGNGGGGDPGNGGGGDPGNGNNGEGGNGGNGGGQFNEPWDSWEHLHDFTGLPMTEDGWTDLLAMYQHPDYYQDSRIIYVSSSTGNDATGIWYTPSASIVGDDPFDPVGPLQPFKTLAAAYGQLRDGYPDLMLLKRGDTWTEDPPKWGHSGRSSVQPMILGTYGSFSTARPVIPRFRTYYGINEPERRFDYMVVVGIEWEGTFSREIGGEFFLVEDCATFDAPNSGMTIQGLGPDRLAHFTLRRCVIADRYPEYDNGTGHTQGIFVKEVEAGLFEENVWDRNGWKPGGQGLDAGNIHSHNTYINVDNADIVTRYNVSTRAGSHGLQMGAGGLLYANLSVQDSIAIQMARSEVRAPNGFSGTIKSNVVLHPKDIQPTIQRGWGIRLLNIAECLIDDNVLAHNPDAGQPVAIYLEPDIRYNEQMRVRNVTISNNIIHDFRGRIEIDEVFPNLENVRLLGNAMHNSLDSIELIRHRFPNADQITSSANNTFYSINANTSRWFRYDGDWMTLETWKQTVGDTTSIVEQCNPIGPYTIPDYMTSIGETPTLSAFYDGIRAQRRGHWDPRFGALRVINFVRTQFELPTIPDIDYTRGVHLTHD